MAEKAETNYDEFKGKDYIFVADWLKYILRQYMCRCINIGMNVWNAFKCCCEKHCQAYDEYSL